MCSAWSLLARVSRRMMSAKAAAEELRIKLQKSVKTQKEELAVLGSTLHQSYEENNRQNQKLRSAETQLGNIRIERDVCQGRLNDLWTKLGQSEAGVERSTGSMNIKTGPDEELHEPSTMETKTVKSHHSKLTISTLSLLAGIGLGSYFADDIRSWGK